MGVNVLNSFLHTPPAGGAWTPADLATLWSWYDPSDTDNRTVTSLLFTELVNKEGTTARNLAQATSTNCPALNGTINGLDALEFNGSDNWMSHSSPGLYAAGACTIATVVRAAVQSDKHIINESGTGTTNIYSPVYTYWSGSNGTPTSYIQVHGGSVQFGGFNDGTVAFLEGTLDNHICIAADSGSNMTHYVDGFQSSSKAYTRGSLPDLAHFDVGALRFISGNFGFFSGLMGEIVCCTGVLSTGDRQSLEGYLAHKWGAADELDAGHPYKAGPP